MMFVILPVTHVMSSLHLTLLNISDLLNNDVADYLSHVCAVNVYFIEDYIC